MQVFLDADSHYGRVRSSNIPALDAQVIVDAQVIDDAGSRASFIATAGAKQRRGPASGGLGDRKGSRASFFARKGCDADQIDAADDAGETDNQIIAAHFARRLLSPSSATEKDALFRFEDDRKDGFLRRLREENRLRKNWLQMPRLQVARPPGMQTLGPAALRPHGCNTEAFGGFFG